MTGTNRGLHHIAYWTDDLGVAMRQATELLGVGPFRVIEPVGLGDIRFRGELAVLDHSAAFAQWGPVIIELNGAHDVQPPELCVTLRGTRAMLRPAHHLGRGERLPTGSPEAQCSRIRSRSISPPHRFSGCGPRFATSRRSIRMGNKVLGLSAGNADGSAEILLKKALRGAEQAGAAVSLVRIDDLDLWVGPDSSTDDADWLWDQLMESDALIVSAPLYTRTIPGKLRLLGDKISGPQADVAFTEEILRMRAAGETIAVQFPIDERVLRPRVAGFISVGGSVPPYWKTLALPLMHTLTASMQAAVVDQVQFAGAGSPSSIVLDPAALERAAQLGRNVANSWGEPTRRPSNAARRVLATSATSTSSHSGRTEQSSARPAVPQARWSRWMAGSPHPSTRPGAPSRS